MRLQLDEWQYEVLNHDGHLVLCTGRQNGKTTIMSMKAAKYMLDKPKSQIIVVSLTEDQAHLMIIMILTYLEQNHRRDIAKGKKKPTKSKIQLTNGSSVIARPVGNTGDAVRGFTGNVLIIDEASRMPEMMFTAAKPTLFTTGGQIWLCSTPHGKQGYFWQCFQNKRERFKVFHINSEDVANNREISESWTREQKKEALQHLSDEKGEMTKLEYAQEYLARFVDDLRQFFPDNLIRSRMLLKRSSNPLFNHLMHQDFFLGVDIGRMGEDPSTFEIVERHGDTVLHRDNQLTSKTRLTETAEHIITLDGKYNFKRIYVDDEGIGIGVFDMLMSNDSTKRKTEGLKNSRKIIDYKDKRKTRMLKVDRYMNLLRLLEQSKIQLLDDSEIFLSFKSVQYEYTTDKKGKPFLHIFGNDTHIVEGLIRAAWCVKQKNLKLFVSYF